MAIKKEYTNSEEEKIKNPNKNKSAVKDKESIIEENFKSYMKLPLNYSFNENNVYKFLKACSNETRPIAKLIIKNTRHVSFEQMIIYLNINIRHLISKVSKDRPIYLCIKKEYMHIKSNYWLYLYIRDYIKYKYPKIILKLLICDDINSIKQENLIKRDIFVFIDDCIYTGTQMTRNIEDFIKLMKNIYNDSLRIYIYILSSFISTQGINAIKSLSHRNFKIIFNKYIENLPLTTDILSESQMETMRKYYGINRHDIYEDFSEKYLIYFDHKLADFVSTIPLFYSGIVPNKHNKKIFDKTDDYINEDKMQVIPLFKNCEKIRNFDIYEPICPSTPYKKYINKSFMKKIDKKKKALSY